MTGAVEPAVVQLDLMTATADGAPAAPSTPASRSRGLDAIVLEVLPPDPATMDLAEAPRIVGGGAGLGSPARFDAAGRRGGPASALDRRHPRRHRPGLARHERQIGTTGVVVDPGLYLAFGISGAVQHISGLGQPDHVISVNTDPSCPMMQLADLAVVTDANAVLAELVARLAPAGSRRREGSQCLTST